MPSPTPPALRTARGRSSARTPLPTIRAMLDQAPEPTPADDPTYAAALAGAAQLLADEARAAGAYTGKEPFNFTVAALFPAAQVAGGAPQVPTGLLTHQIARF